MSNTDEPTSDTFSALVDTPTSGNDLMDLLKDGAQGIDLDTIEYTKVTIGDNDGSDSDEIRIAKDNIEFSSNAIRQIVEMTKKLAASSSNARYIEAIATLLNTLSVMNTQLITINKTKAEGMTTVTNTGQKQVTSTADSVVMTTEDAVKRARDRMAANSASLNKV